MNKVVHFEIPVSDLQKAQQFYSSVFGWQMMQFDDENVMASTVASNEHGMPTEPGAINGSLYKATGKTPNVVVEVPDIRAHIEIVKQHGGQLVDDVQEVPQMGYYARFKDLEGNLVGLWQTIGG